MKLTQEQYDNLDCLHQKLKKKYPNFQGFNGSAEDMQIIGIDENIIEQEIKEIDLQALIQQTKQIKPLTLEERIARLEEKIGIE